MTRPAQTAAALAGALSAAGADPVVVPLLRIVPPADPAPLIAAAGRLARFDWLVFTSANGVRALAGAAASGLAGPRAACVGPATARVLAEHGRVADLVPEHGDAASLAAAVIHAVEADGPAGASVLWPRAERASPELAEALTRAGMRVDAPVAYRTVVDEAAVRELARLIGSGRVDVVTLTSPSAVAALAAVLRGEAGVRIAVIGSVTASAAREAGLKVHVEPAAPTIAALAAAVVADAGEGGRRGGGPAV
ncbi:MAG TPA: uroporphyrinogen-III synthase [Longimicrobiales bacterium]|nr:uroporphyrinogen-III synthase [Longimicrobiales bacterium]